MLKDTIQFLKQLMTNKKFWRVQWLNIEYFYKYLAKYNLIILSYSILMGALYGSLLADSSLNFTKEQSQSIVNFMVQLFIVIRMLRFFASGFRILFPKENKVESKKRLNQFLKQLLFVLLVTSSPYLRLNSIIKVTSIEEIPDEIVFYGAAWLFSFIVMSICIRLFWKNLSRQVVIQEITSNESLENDVCANKVTVSNEWNEFVRALEVGMVYQYSKSGNLYVDKEKIDEFVTTSDTMLKRTAYVALNYSTSIQEITRINAPKVIRTKGK